MSLLMIWQEKEGKDHTHQCVVFLMRLCWCVDSLQEVNATPVRFISDLLVEDSWSHVFMDTLAARGFVKVREGRGRDSEIVLCGNRSYTFGSCIFMCVCGCVYLNSWYDLNPLDQAIAISGRNVLRAERAQDSSRMSKPLMLTKNELTLNLMKELNERTYF